MALQFLFVDAVSLRLKGPHVSTCVGVLTEIKQKLRRRMCILTRSVASISDVCQNRSWHTDGVHSV